MPVSPGNPCPFLRALVEQGLAEDGANLVSKLSATISGLSGPAGAESHIDERPIAAIAVVANGLGPTTIYRSYFYGVRLDQLRDGPLDKHGVGSGILDSSGRVVDEQLARLDEYARTVKDPETGSEERGLTSNDLVKYMDANYERSKDRARFVDRRLMNGEWPVLLKLMGRGEDQDKYLSVAEVRTLFVERKLPERVMHRLAK
ncbi:hypothetical protein DFJ74DRAFT_654115 [Hyaloraphidium curvatum]|nr:hypothetical protein DFJ74DRAFT_654115 [Hyaloraphidium curvatum]